MRIFFHYTIIRPVLFITIFCMALPSWSEISFAQNTLTSQEPSNLLESSYERQAKEEHRAYEDIPDAYLDEAQHFFNYCEITESLFQYHDCECMASRFLDTRIDMGPEADRSHIMLAIERECPDASEAAGQEYQNCLGSAVSLPAYIDEKLFCECYARTYAELFETYNRAVSSKVIVAFKTQARVTCTDPSLGSKLYPPISPKRR